MYIFETVVNWLANKSPPWAAYRAFMSGRPISHEKQSGFCPVGVGETWICLFAKFVLRVTVPEATSACHDDQFYAGLKALIGGTFHGVQAIWDTKLDTKDWGFLLVDSKDALNDINQIGMLWTVFHL